MRIAADGIGRAAGIDQVLLESLEGVGRGRFLLHGFTSD
jgi:hypothetical protein